MEFTHSPEERRGQGGVLQAGVPRPRFSKEPGAGSPSNELGLRESHRKPPTRAACGRRTCTRRRRLPSECALTPSAARCSPQGAALHPSKVHSLNPLFPRTFQNNLAG